MRFHTGLSVCVGMPIFVSVIAICRVLVPCKQSLRSSARTSSSVHSLKRQDIQFSPFPAFNNSNDLCIWHIVSMGILFGIDKLQAIGAVALSQKHHASAVALASTRSDAGFLG